MKFYYACIEKKDDTVIRVRFEYREDTRKYTATN